MNYQQDFKQIIKLYTVNGNFDAPLYHCQQDSVHLPCNYYCSLVVCGQTYSTAIAHPSKNCAESEAARLACKQLNLLPQSYVDNNTSSSPFITDNQYDCVYTQPHNDQSGKFVAKSANSKQPIYNRTKPYQTTNLKQMDFSGHKKSSFPQDKFIGRMDTITSSKSKQNPNIKELRYYLKTLPVDPTLKAEGATPIQVSSIYDVWKYMHGEVLANAIKSFAAFVAQEENVKFPAYKCEKTNQKLQGLNLYRGECHLKDQVFESLGMLQCQ